MSEPRKSSIVNGELVRCSISQVKTADASQDGGCLRKWFWDKRLGMREGETPAMRESTKGHTIAERYLTDGTEPAGDNAIERAFLAGKHLLPRSGKPEFAFDGEISLAGVPFNGKIDIFDPEPRSDGIHTIVEVWDHKFLRDLSQGKTSEQVIHDPQMTAYAMVAHVMVPEATHVALRHVTYCKSEPRPYPGAIVTGKMVPVDTVRAQWYQLTGVVERMKAAARESDPLAVPGNFGACRAYGKKCMHFDTCHGVKKMGLSEAEKALFMDLTEKIVTSTTPPVITRPSLIIDESTIPDAILKFQRANGLSPGVTGGIPNGNIVTDAPGWVEVSCPNGHIVGKRPPGHIVASAACDDCRIDRAKSAGLLAPDAPYSDPDLAAACTPCEDTKNFQHKPEDCPKKDEPVKKRGRKSKVTPADVVAVDATPVVKVPGTQAGSEGRGPTLSLRDQFAVAALSGIADSTGVGLDCTARLAYRYADAMLGARDA